MFSLPMGLRLSVMQPCFPITYSLTFLTFPYRRKSTGAIPGACLTTWAGN